MKTQLYRSRTDTMLGGVCGGIGAYLGVDPVWIRLFFVLLTISGGSGVLLYLIGWVIIPLESEDASATVPLHLDSETLSARIQAVGNEMQAAAASPHPQAAFFIGAAMLILGVIYLLRSLGIYWIAWLNPATLWPLLLVAGGIGLMLRRRQGASS